MSEKADKASSQIEERVRESNNTIDDGVRRDIDEALKTNQVQSPEEMSQVGQRLEQEGVLPTLLLDKDKQNELYQKYSKDGGQTLDSTKLREAAANEGESPYNRLLAQSLYDRYSAMDTDGEPGVSRAELESWANKPKDAGGNNVTVEGDANNPDKITRTNVNGETEVIERSGDKYIVRRTNADGSTSTGEAKNLKSDGNGGYTYETSGAKVEQKANGERVVTNTETGDVTTLKTDAEGKVVSIEHTDKSGRLSEKLTSDGGNPPKWTVSINGGQGGNFEVQDVKWNGSRYSYKHENGTTYEQETERDARTVTSADGKNVTRYNFGADGKPTYIGSTFTDANGRETKIEIKPEGDHYVFTNANGEKRDIEQPSVWHGGFSFKTLDGKDEMAYYSDGSQKRTQNLEDGSKRSVKVNTDGSAVLEEKSADGTKSKKIEVGADGNVTKIEDKNAETTTTIVQGENGEYTKTVKYNDGSKPDETSTVTDVQASDDGTYTYKQEMGPNGRKFTFDQDGNMTYDVRSWAETGDCLYAIASDMLEAKLGQKPTNAQIWEMINSIAQESGISDPNKIGIGQVLKMPKGG